MSDVSAAPRSNWALKEEIRSYWSARAATFDDQFGHRILPGPEREAWKREFAERLGAAPVEVLDLACGTGQITGVLLELGHRVTGLDFSEDMLARARAKHAGRARFVLGDAETTMEDDVRYDAVVCRHLVWTLTDPQAALAEWLRVLKPGGRLVVFDGDFVDPPFLGRLAKAAIARIDAWTGAAPHRDPRFEEQHRAIMAELPFRDGLRFEGLARIAAAAGFTDIRFGSYARIARAQRRGASLRDRLRTFAATRFVLDARKP